MPYLLGAYIAFVGIMLIFAFLLYQRQQNLRRQGSALDALEQERARQSAALGSSASAQAKVSPIKSVERRPNPPTPLPKRERGA